MKHVWRSVNGKYHLYTSLIGVALVALCFLNLNLATMILGVALLFGTLFLVSRAIYAYSVELGVNYHLMEYAKATKKLNVAEKPNPGLTSIVIINNKMFLVVETDRYGLIATVYKVESTDLDVVWIVFETVGRMDCVTAYQRP